MKLIKKLVNCKYFSDLEKEIILKQYILNWITDEALIEKIKMYTEERK
jgi:hypothetical protein